MDPTSHVPFLFLFFFTLATTQHRFSMDAGWDFGAFYGRPASALKSSIAEHEALVYRPLESARGYEHTAMVSEMLRRMRPKADLPVVEETKGEETKGEETKGEETKGEETKGEETTVPAAGPMATNATNSVDLELVAASIPPTSERSSPVNSAPMTGDFPMSALEMKVSALEEEKSTLQQKASTMEQENAKLKDEAAAMELKAAAMEEELVVLRGRTSNSSENNAASLTESKTTTQTTSTLQWELDSSSTVCTLCRTRFTLLKRRHRQCGCLCCASCGPKRKGSTGGKGSLRVCKNCMN